LCKAYKFYSQYFGAFAKVLQSYVLMISNWLVSKLV
jgi:hypothetical protein